MKTRKIVQTVNFSKEIDKFLKKGLLKNDDFNALEKELTQNPESGDIIPGMNGIRKIRIKVSNKGEKWWF